MKRVLSLFLSCIFVLGVCFSTPIVASAAEEDEKPVSVCTYEVTNEVNSYCALKSYTDGWLSDGTERQTSLSISGSVTIDEKNYTVTSIQQNAFNGVNYLKTLTIDSIIDVVPNAGSSIETIRYKIDENNTIEFSNLIATYTGNALGITVSEDCGYTVSIVYDDKSTPEEENLEEVIEAGSYTATVKFDSKTLTFDFTIKRATLLASDFTFTEPDELTYDGQQKVAMVTSEKLSDENITVKYYDVVDGAVAETGSTEVPTDVGTYKVQIDVQATDNYEAASDLTDDNWKFEITKDEASITTFPTPNTLTYTGGAQDLVTVGTVTGGTIYYTLTPDAENDTWSTGVPKETNAGTYKVYYKVVGDDNHNDIDYSEENFVEVIITQKSASEITIDPITDQIYTGNEIRPVVIKDGDVVLIEGTDYDVVYSNNTNVGNATVTITFKGNYSGEVTKTFEIVAHKHLWSYKANEETDTITATCTGEGNCGVGNQTATITLKLPENSDWVYNNSEKKFAFIDGSIDGVTLPEIVYSGDCINAGDYTASITLLGEDEKEATVTVPFAIEKAPSKLVSVPEINEGLEYSGNFQYLINEDKAGEAEGGVINYKVNDGDWSTAVPSYTAPGTYKVYYKVVGDANHSDTAEVELSVTIAPKTIDVKALADIEYTGENHAAPEIVFDGTIKDVDVEYSVTYMRGGKEETDFKDVGVITVTVKLESEVYIFEDDTISKKLTFEIKKAAASVAIAPTANELTYDGKEHALITAGSATGGTMQYKLGEAGEWSTNIPTAKDAGTYTVYYKVVGDANHSDSAEASISVTIGKAPVTISVETQERVYDGTNAVEIKSATVSDVVSGEEISVNFDGVTATSIDGTGVGTHTVEFKGDFELVGKTAGNYEIGAVSGVTVTITAKPLTITAKDATVVVNSVMPKFEYTIEGLVDSDSIANVEFVATVENSSTVVENTATAGTYVITPSGAVIEKGDTDVTTNYEITYKTGVFTVTACTKHEWKNSKCEICKIDCEHKYEDGKSAISNKATTQATCVKEGVLLTQCKICDYKAESPLDIVSDAHKMSDWKETVKATCSSTGTEERVCELGCGHKETRPTEKDPDNHTYGDWVITAATCVADGVKVKTCKNTECKHELKETIAKDPTAHKMATEWEVTKKPTCVETGLQVKACLNAGCDHEVEEVIAIKADAHNLGGWVVTKAAKCTIAGEITRFCKNGSCEYKVTDSLDPDGKTHAFAEDFTVIEPTCILKGSKFKVCENEGCKEVAEKTEIAINPDAHKNIVTVNAKDATCEEKGYTGDKFCNDCKKTVDPGIEINAKGHTESDWIVDKEATFTEEGARHTVCKVCNKELKKEVVAKLTLATPSPKAYNKTGCIKVKWADVDNALTYNVYRSEYVNKKWTTWKRIASNVKQGVGYYNDKNVTEGKQYKYTVKAYNGDFVSGKKASNKLIFISPVKPSLTTTTTGIILKWNTVLGADKYIAYRSQIVDGKWSDWKKVATITDGKSSWVDTTAESGVTYKYSVRVYKGSSYSNRDASNSIIFLTQPTLKLSNTSTGIKGSWKTVNGATGYVITRAEYNDSLKKYGPKVKIGTASGTAKSFTDKTAKAGVKYKYTITAINGSYSSIVSSAKSYRCLAQPTVTIENTNGAIKGSWTQVTGAASYIIYRSEVVNGKWSSWKNLGTAGATAKSFTDKTVKSGVKYKYRVIAKNGGSKSSAEASNKLVYLACPKATVSNSIYGAKVKWNVITGAESYIVYRKSYVNKQWTAWQQIATTSTNSYTDSTAVSGAKYRYTIHAVNDGSLSARKDSASFVYVEAPKTTTTVTAKAITLNWNEIGGAKKYVVYRAELGSDGKWSSWTKVASLKDINTFADTTVVAGKTYKYKVNACIGKSKSSSNATDGVLVPKAQ